MHRIKNKAVRVASVAAYIVLSVFLCECHTVSSVNIEEEVVYKTRVYIGTVTEVVDANGHTVVRTTDISLPLFGYKNRSIKIEIGSRCYIRREYVHTSRGWTWYYHLSADGCKKEYYVLPRYCEYIFNRHINGDEKRY